MMFDIDTKWPDELMIITGYGENYLIPCVNEMLAVLKLATT